MAQVKKYRLATATHSAPLIISGDSAIVPEDLFLKVLEMAIKDMTKEQPEKYDEVFKMAIEQIANSGKALLINGINFKYSKKP